MAAAAITSSSSSSISNVTSNAASSAAILALSSTSQTSSVASGEAVSGSLSCPTVVSSSSRSRRSKISHYYQGSGAGTSSISSTSSFTYSDSKPMHPSSNVGSSSKSTTHAAGSSEAPSKSKNNQRRWKDDSGCKSKSLKWKANSDHVGIREEIVDRSTSKSNKWKTTEKSKFLSANLYKMRGMKWKAFTDHILESDEELRNISEEDEETVLRLDQSDMGLYGLCPETDPFYAVICDICNAVVKPQGLQKHLVHRHHSSHNSKHHSQHSVNHHRNVFGSYSAIGSGLNLDRAVVDHTTSTVNTVISSATLQVSPADRHEKASLLCKSAIRDISPGRSHGSSHQQGSSRSSGGSGAHSSSSSSTGKSKSKSTSKVKSKSGKSGKSKSGGNSSNHSSTAPSPSSSSSSSYSGATSRTGSSSITTTTVASNGSTATTSSTHQASAISGNSAPSTSSSLSNKSNTTSPTTATQSQTNQKNLRTSCSPIASSLTHTNSTHNTTHVSQSSSQNNAVISSKANSSTSSKQNNISNDSAGPAIHSSSPSSPHCSTNSSQNINIITSSTNSPANNVSVNSVTPRRTYGRCKSSSVERKIVPVKEREYDANKHCGVVSGESSRPCTRSLTCKAHSLSMRRMVSGRSKSFDKLLADHRATKEQPQPTVKSRTMPELESSNSSCSIDLDRRSVSSNSNLSVEVQASSTASSQSSATSAVESVSCNRKQATPPPLANNTVNKSNNPVVPLCTSGGNSSCRETIGQANNRLPAIPVPIEESSDPAIVETVETVCMGSNDNTIQININREGATQSIPGVSNRRSNANPSQQQRRGSSEESHRARITTRVIDTNRAEVPPELLDDSKFTTNIFSPESTVLTGPIRLLAEDENVGGSSKRSRLDSEPELDITTLSDEKRLQLMVQRKVNKKNKVLFRDPNRPSPSAITIPPAAEIVAQAFAEENPSATLTDAQFVMDPETNVVSVSVCGTFNPDNMQLNWAPFNQDFVNNTLSQALSPYGITVPPVAAAQPEQQVYGNPNLMPNPEEEGFQIHHLPPLTEEEYNQMRPEFINGMPKPSMLGCPGIKAEIKQEMDDDTNKASVHQQPILPMIKQEGLRDGIKIEIKQEPMDEETSENLGTTMDCLNSSHIPLIQETKSDVSQISTTIESVTDTSTVSESAVPDWTNSLNSLNSTASSEVLAEKTNQSPELMSLDMEDSSDDSYVEYLQPIATLMSRVSGDLSSAANGKENSNSENDDRAMRYQNQANYSSDEYACISGSKHNFYYGRLPKPNHVNTFGLVKLRGSTNFKKSILCTRRANSSIHAYQTLFQGGHCTFFRRDNANTLGSKHCTVDCNGAISLNGSTTFDGGKAQSTNSPGGGPRNNCTMLGNSMKTAKQTRRQNSGVSPNSLLLKRQSSSFALTSASTQTPPSSPFYKRHNSVTAGNKVRLQKRSIIMHFRGNGSSQQHLSKTCAILQSQIVHKLAEQLLGFKKNNSKNEQPTPSTSFIKAGFGKQPLQQSHHSSNINCKLPSSSSSLPSLTYQSTSIESGSLQSGITSSLPTLSSALSSPPIQQNTNNPVKIPRTSATVVSCSSTSSLAKVNSNTGVSRMTNNSISQRFSAVTPVAIVAPLVAKTAPPAPANPLVQTSSTVGLTACNNGNLHQGRGRNSMYRQNSMLTSSTPGPSAGALNGIGAVKSNGGSNNSGVN